MTQAQHIPEKTPPVSWMGGPVEYPRDTPVHRLFEARAARTPDVVAISTTAGSLTYAQLNTQANRLARFLAAHLAHQGTPVAFCLDRSPELIAAQLAILKAGCCYVPLDPAYPTSRIETMARDCGASLILTTRPLAALLPGLPGKLLFVDDLPHSSDPSENLSTDVSATAPAYIMFTSGSTGQPKGVTVPHRAIARLVLSQDYIALSPNETFLQFAPASFDASTLEIWGPLLNGGRLAIAPSGQLSLDQIAATIRSLGVTSLWLTSGLFNLMADEQLDAFAPLRQLLAGGDVLSIRHVRKVMTAHPHLRLVNGYGPTESTTFACFHTVTAVDLDRVSIPIGKPIANTTVRILDEHRAIVPIGVPGELYIGGDGLALGYWNQPALNTEKFVDLDGETFYRTGDSVRWLPTGVIEFLGRQDHQVKIRGFRIELAEIEAVLSRQPGVLRSVVVAIGEGANKRLAAYHAGPAEPSALREALRQSLPDYMVPAFFTRLDTLPLTENGKVDHARLPAPFIPSAPSEQPHTDLEKTLSNLWSEILSLPVPGRQANFFDIGGTSLKLVEAHARLVRALHRQIPVTALFQFPTIASLAAYLASDASTPASIPSRLTAAAERGRKQREVLARKKLPRKVP